MTIASVVMGVIVVILFIVFIVSLNGGSCDRRQSNIDQIMQQRGFQMPR